LGAIFQVEVVQVAVSAGSRAGGVATVATVTILIMLFCSIAVASPPHSIVLILHAPTADFIVEATHICTPSQSQSPW